MWFGLEESQTSELHSTLIGNQAAAFFFFFFPYQALLQLVGLGHKYCASVPVVSTPQRPDLHMFTF